MTTVRMTGLWVEWNAAHTAVVDFGRVQMDWIGAPVLAYSYQEGWSEGSAPGVDLFPAPDAVRVRFGDGSVRFISDVTDGTSNTVLFTETTGETPFSGHVLAMEDLTDNHSYYFGLDGALPDFQPGDVQFILPFLEQTAQNAQQIVSGPFAPGEPILLDGTSNTIFLTENDSLPGGAGEQAYHGGAGRDLLRGGAGNDMLDGGDGGDRLSGDGGADSLLGGASNDRVSGGGGDDLLFGGLGNDTVAGGGGNDRLFGGDPLASDPTGDDDLFGGRGNDSLYGTLGADILDGGAGDDLLVLGGGADAIVFSHGSGQDRIADFNVAEGDVIRLNANLTGGLTSGADVLENFGTFLGDGSVRLTFDADNTLLIEPADGLTLDRLAFSLIVFG